MPAQALYLKWRPQTFEDVIGQEHVTRTLRNALVQGRVRHAYLFSGPRGTGKTSTARLLAKAVNCQHPDPTERPCNTCDHCVAVNEGRFLDLIEIDAASHTGVDDVRDLRDKIAFSPSEGRYKVYIIDEVHRFSGAAFDALLKTLEEPPEHAIFVLATTEIHKVPATIKSRCLLFEFRRVALAEVAERLALIAEAEGVSIDRAALELIAREGTGSVRDSISLLDQLITDPDAPISLELAEQVLGTASGQNVAELAQALIEQNAAWGLEIINAAVDGGADPRQFGRQMVEHLRQMILVQMGSEQLLDVTAERRAVLHKQAAQIGRRALLRATRAFNRALQEWQGGWQPQLPLELAFLESIQPAEEDAPTSAPTPRAQSAAPRPKAPRAPKPQRPAPQKRPNAPKPRVHLSDVLAAWETVLVQAKRAHRTLPALLQHAHPRDVREDTLILGVNVEVFRQKLEAPKTRQALEQTLAHVLGVPLQVKVQVVAAEELAQDATHHNALAQDDLLAYAVHELGAELVAVEEDEEN